MPDWVRPVDWSATAPREQSEKSEGTRYLLDERQENPKRQEEFVRVLNLMENETGVQDSGSLSFQFDPSYQELILHQVQIHRMGQVLNRLDKSKIKTIQPEAGLDGHMLTGKHSALVFVEDLRVGDVLEYSYTTRGYNPLLRDHYSTRFGVQFGVPVNRRRMRVVWPSEKPLHVRTHLTQTSPVKMIGIGTTEYIWDLTNLTALAYEDCLPENFEPYPYVELSDFKDWARVVDWALPLYATASTDLPPELQQLVVQWRTLGTSDEERARLALEFVQDELRYTGLELGPDSYRPTPPFETFQKRFGDCKGKALLLCTILRAMNFQAWPALVNSSAREAIANRLPSPFAFNHVIVKLNLGGKVFWLDPTYSYQGGELAKRFLSRLGKALVIQSGVTALEDVPMSLADNTRQLVLSTFQIRDYKSPTKLTVQSTYGGCDADDLREQIARKDIKEIGKDYLNFYARSYPTIESTQPITVSDDRKNNVLILTEHYQIRDIWKLNPATKMKEAEFYGDNLLNVLTDPNTRLRSMPLRIPFPLQREHQILVHLPDREWNIPNAEKTIDHDAFFFHYRRTFSGKIVRYQFECKTKIPELPAQKVADYLVKLDEMETEVGEKLQRPDDDLKHVVGSLNWLMVVTAAFGAVSTLAGVFWVWRAPRPAGNFDSGQLAALSLEDQKLQGLGGWLFLVGFGLCLGPITRIVMLLKSWEGFFSIHVWQAVAMPQGDQYHPLYAPLLICELLGNIALIGLNVLAISLYFAQRKAFPKTFMLLLCASAVLIIADNLVSHQIPFLADQTRGASSQIAFRAVLNAIIWSAYMLKSRRVKNTFVR